MVFKQSLGLTSWVFTVIALLLLSLCLHHCQVPWTDLRYLFGEIMYGGHITDDWDRRLCKTYLEEYMKPEMVSEIQHKLLL